MRRCRNTGWLALILMVLLSASGCLKKQVRLNPSPSVPAATASAAISHDKNGNKLVDLKVKHLAKPESLTPAHSVYLVQIQPRGGAPIRQGQLEVNSNLEGELKFPTTYKTFEIFVTAEDSAMADQPKGPEVLRQSVSG
jgi:hypothetical protein